MLSLLPSFVAKPILCCPLGQARCHFLQGANPNPPDWLGIVSMLSQPFSGLCSLYYPQEDRHCLPSKKLSPLSLPNPQVKLLEVMEGMDRETFEFKFGKELTFTTVLSDQQVVELIPGGAGVVVGYEDRSRFIQLVQKARLEESKEQVVTPEVWTFLNPFP